MLLFFVILCYGTNKHTNLTSSALVLLEENLRNNRSYALRTRCQVIILKSQGRYSADVGKIVGMSYVSVNSWVSRYKESGFEGLQTKKGRGRKPKIAIADKEIILKLIQANRQRLEVAHTEWEAHSGKKVSKSTFRAFLKVLAEDINA